MHEDSGFSRAARAGQAAGGGSGYGPGDGDPGWGGGGHGGYGGGPGGYPPPRRPRRRSWIMSHLGVAVLAAALAAGVTLGFYHPGPGSGGGSSRSTGGTGTGSGGTGTGGGAVPTPPAPSSPAGSGAVSASTRQVLAKVEPGVVIINTRLQYSGEAAAGTGMVINPDGLVLTNNHVIDAATKITATVVRTGRIYQARVVGYDKSRDVALLRLQGASGLHTVPIGNSGTVRTGQRVVAMGNAEGLGTLVPAPGTVAATGVTITAADQGSALGSETLHGLTQVNADVVSGDSGGPLANTAGQVVGMDTAANSVSYQQQGTAGFAIPLNSALAVARQIAAGHASSTITIGYPPFLGIFLGTSPSSNPRAQAGQQGGLGGPGTSAPGASPHCVTSNVQLTVPPTIAPASSGTLAEGVICGSPAAAAGLTAGSVITAVNGQAAGSPAHFMGLVSKFRPGDTIRITWVSPSGRTSTSPVRLAAGPPQ